MTDDNLENEEDYEKEISWYLYEIERAERKRIAEIEYNNELFNDLEYFDEEVDGYYNEDY